MAKYLLLTHDEADSIRMCPPHMFDAVEMPGDCAVLPVAVLGDPEFHAVLERERLEIDLTALQEIPD